MEKLNNKLFLRSMTKMAVAITGLHVEMHDCTQEDAIGYCTREKSNAHIAVAINYDFPNLDQEQIRCLLYGVFAHEVMHLIRTDFDYKKERILQYPKYEQKARHYIWNIVEDPAIEHFSKNHLSEFLQECLDKQIAYFYDRAKGISEYGGDAYIQYINAMIMFGDIGILKGYFDYPEAEEAFRKTAPIMLKAIEEPDAKQRFELSQEIFEIIKPLWEQHDERMQSNKEIQDLLDEFGTTSSEGEGSSLSDDPLSQEDESKNGQRRRQMIEIISKDAGENETDSEENSMQQFKKLSEQMQNELENNLSISEKTIQNMKDIIDSVSKSDKKEKEAYERKCAEDNPIVSVSSPYYDDISYNVESINATDESAYKDMIFDLKPYILNFRSSLKKIFHKKYAKKLYHTTGKLNVERFCGKKLTARVFEKQKDTDNKEDLAIVMLIDRSSSISRYMKLIIKTCMVVLEGFAVYDVPIKVIAFSSPTREYDAVYYHYGKWVNDTAMRMSIPTMFTCGSTFLGHAIRYAGNMLKQRRERKRLLIVLTDGEPYHYRYKNRDDGYADCRYAVEEISKFADIIGVGIDEYDVKRKSDFQYIFRKNYMQIKDMEAIVKELPKRIGKLIES